MSHQLIVGLDFSPHMERVVESALQIGKAFGSHVYCIHVAAPEPEFVGMEVGPQHEREWRAKELRAEHRDLEKVQQQFAAAGLDCTAMLVSGQTVEKLMEECDRRHADLLILGTHGHSRVHELMMGSTAHGVVRRAIVPVLLVPLKPTNVT